MSQTTEKQFLRCAVLGVAGLCVGALLWLAELASRNSLQIEYLTVMRLGAISIIVSSAFWLLTSWIAHLRDAGR
jgi:hypothetical protein